MPHTTTDEALKIHLTLRDELSALRPEIDDLRQWREATQRRRGIVPIDSGVYRELAVGTVLFSSES